MSEMKMKPVSLAVGTALATGLASVSVAKADVSPFAMTALASGYMADEPKAEGKCGVAAEASFFQNGDTDAFFSRSNRSRQSRPAASDDNEFRV